MAKTTSGHYEACCVTTIAIATPVAMKPAAAYAIRFTS